MQTEDQKILNSVKKRDLSSTDLERVLVSHENAAPQKGLIWEDYYGKHAKFGIISDSHIGHEKFDIHFSKHISRRFKQEGIDTVYHCGDLLEGMSGRPGHIYELSEIGFENQMKLAVEVFGEIFKDFNIRGINGNHDQWYIKKNNGGVSPSFELENRIDNYQHLGDNEANIELSPHVKMKIFHANDGSAYAVSYKLQKLVESLSGGEKPEILVEGHYHKAMYMFIRNVHAFEAGTLCGQTDWMRGKKIQAHKGAWILDLKMGKGGIGEFKQTFIPGYK